MVEVSYPGGLLTCKVTKKPPFRQAQPPASNLKIANALSKQNLVIKKSTTLHDDRHCLTVKLLNIKADVLPPLMLCPMKLTIFTMAYALS